MSVEAAHATVIECCGLFFVSVMPPGTDGASVSLGVTVTAAVRAEVLPLASTAATVYAYCVPFVRPVSVYDGPAGVPTSTPPRYTL